MALVTLDEVKEALESPPVDDALLANLIDRASRVVERYTGRVFLHTNLTERHDGGSATLYLLRRPVVRVVSVTDTENGIAVPEEHYVIDPGAGMLIRRMGKWEPGVRRWEVSYVAGYGATTAEVPGDVKQAVIQLVTAWYNRRDPGVTSEHIGDYSRNVEAGLPQQVRELLAPYVEVVI